MRIGVDLMRIERLDRIAAHPRYQRVVFTSRELAGAGTPGTVRQLERLASGYCAKEATAKLLGVGLLRGFSWRHVEVLRDELGAPRVELSGGAQQVADRLNLGPVQISITHDGPYVFCVAVAAEPSDADAAPAIGLGRRYRDDQPEQYDHHDTDHHREET